jgi:hypothetical protein
LSVRDGVAIFQNAILESTTPTAIGSVDTSALLAIYPSERYDNTNFLDADVGLGNSLG